jgi:hypothetical protein
VKIPEDAVIAAANVGVQLGTHDDGTPNLVIRVIDHGLPGDSLDPD